jgi:hypothetical protein
VRSTERRIAALEKACRSCERAAELLTDELWLAVLDLSRAILADPSGSEEDRAEAERIVAETEAEIRKVGDDAEAIVAEWVTHLRTALLWGDDDPLFPATRIELGQDRRFAARGLDRKHWSNAPPIRTIFREAFAAAELPYFPPHSLRKTLARLGQSLCRTPEEFKAWSQNLGHEKVMTTFSSYGEVAPTRQAEIIRKLALPPADTAEALVRIRDAFAYAERAMGH